MITEMYYRFISSIESKGFLLRIRKTCWPDNKVWHNLWPYWSRLSWLPWWTCYLTKARTGRLHHEISSAARKMLGGGHPLSPPPPAVFVWLLWAVKQKFSQVGGWTTHLQKKYAQVKWDHQNPPRQFSGWKSQKSLKPSRKACKKNPLKHVRLTEECSNEQLQLTGIGITHWAKTHRTPRQVWHGILTEDS